MGEKTRVIGGASGALGPGTLAAAIGACCGLPWAVALLGVSGAVALARLSFLLPYALLGAGALLAVAFWWAYRPLPVCTDGTCNPQRWWQLDFWRREPLAHKARVLPAYRSLTRCSMIRRVSCARTSTARLAQYDSFSWSTPSARVVYVGSRI